MCTLGNVRQNMEEASSLLQSPSSSSRLGTCVAGERQAWQACEGRTWEKQRLAATQAAEQMGCMCGGEAAACGHAGGRADGVHVWGRSGGSQHWLARPSPLAHGSPTRNTQVATDPQRTRMSTKEHGTIKSGHSLSHQHAVLLPPPPLLGGFGDALPDAAAVLRQLKLDL